MEQSSRNNQKVLKEAKFILPEYSPSGDLMEDVHAELEEILVREFKGYTATPSESVTYDDIEKALVHDDVIIYEIAMEDTKLQLDKLTSLAKKFARILQQSFVYFKYPSGEVYYLDI